ncbi:cyclohexanone monooxygenase [Erythrobacter sp. KY5]|uniref:flavin-containing monooxygenase n=1 Tax=Erythrobacter sp. KY5 TaxID=2011159 RepID=UPI000DBF1050|nr:NAD(P)/FAD-dependent oxidoreductase [Erythrobacter sp. KY5]AWW74422.1 cyclohexanone monooxygenase [Erythrobacter sp. KY5]
MSQAERKSETSEHLDAEVVIIGAGFAGIRALLEMRKRGRTAKVFDAASDVGGTWYWNKYPGARTDSEAWAYCYAMSDELQDDWVWPDRMPSQKHVQAYLSHVADRFDLRKDIQFNTQITGASYDEDNRSWEIATKDGERFRSRYLISAMGWLSVANRPDFPGEDTFSGEIYRSSSWPDHDVDFSNKRVGIIGSGSTAVQMLPIVARLADHVKLFQRTPNYVLPSRNRPLDEHDRASLAKEREENWSLVRQQVFAFPMVTSERVFDSVDDAEREKIFEAGWEAGGFRFLFETFGDILVDERSNAAAADFIRRRIRAIVKDPKTAELLCPDYPFALKRPPLGSHYFEAFNRDNVELVDVSTQAIKKITESGLVAGGGHHDLDMIIFATGFDAVTGPMMAVDVKGRGGVSIRDKWAAGPQTYLGLMTDQFPNMFIMTGPQVPFANLPPIAETSAVWIADLMDSVSDKGGVAAEPRAEAVQGWVDTVNATLDATLLGGGAELRSWFMGANIPGKVQTPLFYFGGAGAFFDQMEQVSRDGFVDIKIS